MSNKITSQISQCDCIVTSSKLVDMLKETWQQHKQTTSDVAGDHYYDKFLQGILFNKTIGLVISHFDQHLQYHLNQLKPQQLQQIVYRAIFETIQSIKGEGFAYSAKTEDRIKWKFC